MPRIELDDSYFSAIAKMCDYNPAAIEALTRLISEGKAIDPDDPLGGMGSVLFLDTLEIYGTDIAVLYSDICDKDLAKMMAVIRAVQKGLFKDSILKDACSRQDYSGRRFVPVDKLYNQVKAQFLNFDRGRA